MGEKVNVVWGYIITSIDEFLLRTLNTQDFRMLLQQMVNQKCTINIMAISMHIYML